MAQPIAHGGHLQAARRRFPGAPEPWIDLSTGINPHAYPVPGLPPEAWTRLPEPEAVAALEAAAAQAYGVSDPACVAAAPGTQSLIQWLPRLRPPGRVDVVGPTYAEHEANWRAGGHQVRAVAGLAETSGPVVVVCNPNNPTGQRHDPVVLLAVAASLSRRNGLLVVDESFADLERVSLAGAVPSPGLLLLRSVGKTYGLAGLRLGFALAYPEMAAAIRAALGPWAVSGAAIAVGGAALADDAWRIAAEPLLRDDSARLGALLAAARCGAIGHTLLFRLVAHGDAAGLAARLGEAGILVRRFAGHPHWLRFGVPGHPGAWDRLARALG